MFRRVPCVCLLYLRLRTIFVKICFKIAAVHKCVQKYHVTYLETVQGCNDFVHKQVFLQRCLCNKDSIGFRIMTLIAGDCT